MIKNFFEAIKLASRLDILNLNYQYSSESFGLDQFVSRNRKRFSGPIFGLMRFFAYFLLNVFRDSIREKAKINGKTIFGYVNSLNQLNVIQPIIQAFPDAVMLGTHKIKGDANFSLSFAYLISFPFFFTLLSRYYSINGFARKMLAYQFDEILLTYGFFIKSYLFFKNYEKISILIVSNDHLMRHRVLNFAAQLNGIRTVYVQHANVRENFPSLEFDYAFLDGEDAFRKYCINSSCNTKTQVVLTGSVKIDLFIERISLNQSNNTLGVSTNENDSVDSVNRIIAELSNSENFDIVLRPHPHDPRKEAFREIALKYSIRFSDPKVQSVDGFFEEINVLISGESSIHLEAAALGIHPIYYNMGGYKEQGFYDSYEFIRNNLINDDLKSDLELKKKVESLLNNGKPYSSEYLGFFIENLKLNNRFSSLNRIRELIINILNRKEISDVKSFEQCS